MISSLVNTIKNGCSVRVYSDGVPPFTWSIQSGPGSIVPVGDDASFTAPNNDKSGVTVIKCVDANLVETTFSMGYGSPLVVMANIIQQGLGLTKDQVHLSYEKFDIPNDKKVYVFLGILNTVYFGNSSKGIQEIEQSVNVMETIEINIMSYDREAENNKHKILFALTSRYATHQQFINAMKIATLPVSFNNVSAVEGAVGLKRFSSSFNLIYSKVTSSQEDYYDQFEDNEIIVRE